MKVQGLIFAALAMLTGIAVADSGNRDSPGKLVEVAQFGQRQPVGLTISEQNRLFVTFPRQSGATDFRYALSEVINGRDYPYPDIQWNTYEPNAPDSHFMNVQAVIAQGDSLWVLDAVQPFGGNAKPHSKLLRIDLHTAKVERIYRFEDLEPELSALNDVRIDLTHGVAYLSDPKKGALVVMDLDTGKTQVRLKGNPALLATPGYVLHIDGHNVVDKAGKPFISNVNGIALTRDDTYLYFRAINQEHLYRIATRYLADPNINDVTLARYIENLGKVGISHGMLADAYGNIYLSDSQTHTINRYSPDGRLTTVIKDERLSWPDTFALDPKGELYITAAQIHKTAQFNQGIDRVDYPYRLYKLNLH